MEMRRLIAHIQQIIGVFGAFFFLYLGENRYSGPGSLVCLTVTGITKQRM